MDIAEEYLKGDTTYEQFYEALTAANIFDMYAAEWVLSKPTAPEGNLRPQLKEEVENRFFRIKMEVQETLIVEGILAIIRESKHVGSRTESQSFSDLYTNIAELFVKNGGVIHDNKIEEDFGDTDLFIVHDDEGEREIAIAKTVFQSLHPDEPALYRDWVRTNFSSPVATDWPEAKSLIENKFDSKYLSVPKIDDGFFSLMEDWFYLLRWNPEFGGRAWGDITSNVGKLELDFPNNSFQEIDHVIDLAHNTDTWLDKFENDESLLSALDVKFESDTPKDWVDKISDRKVKAAVKRV